MGKRHHGFPGQWEMEQIIAAKKEAAIKDRLMKNKVVGRTTISTTKPISVTNHDTSARLGSSLTSGPVKHSKMTRAVPSTKGPPKTAIAVLIAALVVGIIIYNN